MTASRDVPYAMRKSLTRNARSINSLRLQRSTGQNRSDASVDQESKRLRGAKSVPESDLFMPFGLALSEKRIPQITENTEKPK